MNTGMKVMLYGVVLIALMAVVAAVVVGNRFRDPEIEDKPYESGLRWDKDRKLKEGLGFSIEIKPVELRPDRAVFSVNAMGRGEGENTTLQPRSLSMLATRPAGDRPDVACTLAGPAGDLRALCELGAFGHWDMVVTLNTPDGAVGFTEKVYVKEDDNR